MSLRWYLLAVIAAAVVPLAAFGGLNDDARNMLRAPLILAGYEAREACNAPAGIALAAEFRPEVALVDLGLPARRALGAGFDAHLTKPVSLEQLDKNLGVQDQ